MSVFDINGILNVQTKYLDDLSQNTGGNSSTALSNLQNYLNSLYAAYSNSGASADAILTQQTNMKTIIDNENSRLNSKKSQIEDQLFAKQRMAELNDNYKKRQSYINSIFILLVFGLIIFIIIIKLKSFLPFIPEFIFEFLIVILISFIGISIVVKFSTYRSRDSLDFDKLRLPSMNNNNIEETQKNGGNLIGLISENCVGEDCCVTGTEWNAGINKCVPICTVNNQFNVNSGECATTTSLNTAATTGTKSLKVCGNAYIASTDSCSSGFSCMNSITTPSFTPNEFSNYSLYK